MILSRLGLRSCEHGAPHGEGQGSSRDVQISQGSKDGAGSEHISVNGLVREKLLTTFGHKIFGA